MKATLNWTVFSLFAATPIHAQTVIDPDTAITAAIASDIIRDRQAERDARRQPYLSTDSGPIASAAQASDACAADALYQAGPAARLIGRPHAGTMSTGWEVEGMIASPDGDIPFVCSVRNGSVSGVMLRR